ncbi:MAG TPA: hypothetical protein VFS37_14170 [Conexibacter sp.]|nr:hypothetical protein [Conexibacter sp.]
MLVDSAGFGVVCKPHDEPFQRAANDTCTPLELVYAPTAVQFDASLQETSSSTLLLAPAKVGTV